MLLFLWGVPLAFHLALPVHDLDIAKEFYGSILGCEEGRSSEKVSFLRFKSIVDCKSSVFDK